MAEGIEVSAGTINPVMPKRIVGPAEIRQWLSENAKQNLPNCESN
jgi:hypothetical protein